LKIFGCGPAPPPAVLLTLRARFFGSSKLKLTLQAKAELQKLNRLLAVYFNPAEICWRVQENIRKEAYFYYKFVYFSFKAVNDIVCRSQFSMPF
jgi:hypothetical protein